MTLRTPRRVPTGCSARRLGYERLQELWPCVRHRFNGRHLDQKRQLLPRDYAMTPDMFGVDANVEFHVPDGGEHTSMLVAAEQHRLVCEWSVPRRRPSAESLADRWGISIQTISTVCRGERWAGETVLAALSAAVRSRPRTQPAQRS